MGWGRTASSARSLPSATETYGETRLPRLGADCRVSSEGMFLKKRIAAPGCRSANKPKQRLPEAAASCARMEGCGSPQSFLKDTHSRSQEDLPLPSAPLDSWLLPSLGLCRTCLPDTSRGQYPWTRPLAPDPHSSPPWSSDCDRVTHMSPGPASFRLTCSPGLSCLWASLYTRPLFPG